MRWLHKQGSPSTFAVKLSRDGGSTFPVLSASAPTSTPTVGNYNWTVTDNGQPYPQDSVLRVGSNDDPTASDDSVTFQIDDSGFITVHRPNASDTLIEDVPPVPFRFRWSHNLGYRSRVRIELSRDGGTSYTTLVSSWYNNWINWGEYVWTPSGTCEVIGEGCRVKVVWLGDETVYGIGGLFKISGP